MQFHYIVSTPTGAIQRGIREAGSKEELIQDFRQQKFSIISIRSQAAGLLGSTPLRLRQLTLGHISLLDRVIFARHLSIMLRSGLSLVEALRILQEQAAARKMKRIIGDVVRGVSNGASLADSLLPYEQVFSRMVIGMVKVGEASGTLEQNLEYVADQLEKDYEIRRKVRSAMIYPTIVLSATVVLGTGLSVFILPRLVRLFDSFKIELPLITKIFLNVASFLVSYGWYVLIAVVLGLIGLRLAARARPTQPLFHTLYLMLPIIKRMSVNTNLARTCRILSVLLKSGVTITESLSITSQVIENVWYRRELARALQGVEKGTTLAAVLTDERYLPIMANRMIGVGEKTGKLESSLEYLATFYEGELDSATKNLASVIEPILLVFIGVVLGFLAVAIISPIYQFTGSLQP